MIFPKIKKNSNFFSEPPFRTPASPPPPQRIAQHLQLILTVFCRPFIPSALGIPERTHQSFLITSSTTSTLINTLSTVFIPKIT